MRVSLIDSEKITEMILPNEISGVFFMKYYLKNEDVEKLINIEAENNEWVIKSNGSVNVYKDKILMNKLSLTPYVKRRIELCGYKKYIELIPAPVKEEYESFEPKKQTITIGSSENNDIIFGSENKLYATIKLENNVWNIESFEGVYLNKQKVLKKELNIGDIIFINGLRIIWMHSFFKINNPLGMRKINPNTIAPYTLINEDNTKYTPIPEEDYRMELYRSNEYFFHTPRLIENIEAQEITIDDPPTSQLPEENPAWITIGSGLTMGASAIMSGFMVANNVIAGRGWLSIMPSLIMCLALVIGSLIMPKFVNRYQKNKAIKREEYRQKKYKDYLASKEKEIQLTLAKHTQILKANNPTIEECLLLINNNNRRLWSREIKDNDFLNLRVGTGNIPSSVNVLASTEKFTLDNDSLKESVYQIVAQSKTLRDIPITFSLLNNPISAIICNNSNQEKFINSILLQLVTFQSAVELKLVFLLNHNEKEFSFAKFLPHVLSDDKTVRFYAENASEMQNISSYLEDVLKERKSTAGLDEESDNNTEKEIYKKFPNYYVIITDDFINVRSLPIVDNIIKSKINYGFSLVVLEQSLRKLPKECNTFLEVLEKDGCIFQKDLNSQTPFVLDSIPQVDMRRISNQLSKIPYSVADQASELPSSLNFLDMYKVSKIEQLNVLNRWKTNNPTISLKSLVGVHTNGEEFMLDLHEKYHGPHGLIAGSTGSGKSEFIITYVLSMAINYHPDEVQFVLIDYKGGGLAGAFDNQETKIKIPHIAGTITNLDVTDINRALVSINSELKRRQRIFNEARNITNESTIDIYKYQKYYREGILKEPVSHLFIISDEFAELKKEQPEFMSELITTSRIGRSLGVHLILATQKPSGVVNDQIWSNSRFKVCLKVQSRSDSMEMLKRPEAASLKDVGRFYLQVGYDEYFDIGQSGWSGAKYIPSDRIIKKADESLTFIDNVGNVIKNVNNPVKFSNVAEQGDQLTNIVKYLNNIAKDMHYEPKRLWLEKLPEVLYLSSLMKKYSYQVKKYEIKPIIGEYDDPENQYQGLLTLDITKNNTLIYGLPDSGLENLLMTLIYGMITQHSADELNLYIIDMGSEMLRIFNNAPQVGDICFKDDNEKIFNLMLMIDNEIEKRKELFAEYGGTYDTYIAQTKNTLPAIVVILNGYEMFTETYIKIAEMIPPLYRDGTKYGITFLIATGAANSVRMRTMEYFQNRLCLQMANDGDYRTIIPSIPRGLKPSKAKGRGIVSLNDRAYEFQSASIYPSDKVNEIIKKTILKLQEVYPKKATKINVLPKKVTEEEVRQEQYNLEQIPIGFDYKSKQPYYYNFKNNYINVICATDLNNHQGFINEFIKILSKSKMNLKVFDTLNLCQQKENIIHENWELQVLTMYNEVATEKERDSINCYVIIGISNLYKLTSEKIHKNLDTLFINVANFKKSYFIILDNSKDYQQIQVKDWYYKSIMKTEGIWLGLGVSTQLSITFSNISMDDKKLNFADIGFASNTNNYKVIKCLTQGEETSEK